MHHAFGSLAIIQNIDFNELPNIQPQKHWCEMDSKDFMLNLEDWCSIKDEYAVMAVRVALKHVPALQFLSIINDVIKGPYTEQQGVKNKVIPLPVVHKNEQKYSEVVEIMDFYEDTLKNSYEKAGVALGGTRVHVGGDQLTRERFSGAKCLRIGGINNVERFSHLGPITFELFHMMMKLLEVTFKVLYKNDSSESQGSMKAEEIRIKRTNVDPDVRKAYAADKDFVLSFVDAYIVEGLLTFFGMDTIYSAPTKHQPPVNLPPEEMKLWTKQTMRSFVTMLVPQPKTVLEVHPDDIIGKYFQNHF